MANTILPKRKSLSGSVPGSGSLASGELAVNTADGRLYTKMHSGVVVNLPAQSLAGATVPGSVQFGAIGYDSIKLNQGGNAGLYRVATLQPSTLAASRTIYLPDANCDLACTFNGNTITSGLTVNQKVGSLRGNLGDPTAEEMALFDGQFTNKFRFIAPTLQEESDDGTTWVESTRMSAANLGDLMIGGGTGTSVAVIPSAAVGTYGGYRLTWDVVGQTGYVFLNFLYIYSCACGNNIACKVERYNPLNDAWSEVLAGTISNYPGHTSIKHATIAYHPSTTSATTYNKVRITFESTHNSNTNAYTLNCIEWWGGYPGGQRRTAYWHDRDKNTIFPNRVRVSATGSDSDCSLSRNSAAGTGINFADGNTIDLVTASNKRMRVSSSGVGIGTTTTTPTAALHVRGTSALGTSNCLRLENSSQTALATVANDGTTFILGKLGVGAACRGNLAADFSGSVGLPWADSSFVGIQYIDTDAYRLGLTCSTGGRETRVIAKAADGNGKVCFYAGAGTTEHARVHSNGYLGLGITSPASRLAVAGYGTGTMEVGATGHGGNYTGICLNNSANSTSQYNFLSSPTDQTLYINRPPNMPIRFREANADQVIIASGGSVGIGTTSPQSRLSVLQGAITTAIKSETLIVAANGMSLVDAKQGLQFRANGIADAVRVCGVYQVNEAANGNSTALTFHTSSWTGAGQYDLERVRINSAGNVGIGNTAPDARLTVKGSGASSLSKSMIVENSVGTDVLTVRDDGRVGIMQASPAYTLDVTGTIRSTSSITAGTGNISNLNGEYIYGTELYLGGNNSGFIQMYNSNADTIFSVDEYNGAFVNGPMEFVPSTSASPGVEGGVVFERVSNTQLKIKMRGTDLVDRSVTLTLS